MVKDITWRQQKIPRARTAGFSHAFQGVGGLDAETVRFFISQWVPDAARLSDPGVSPLHAADLSGLPPALTVSAEHELLRDDSEAYATRLRDAGVDVEFRCEPGLIHNFMLLDEISPACAAAADRIVADLRTRLSAPRTG